MSTDRPIVYSTCTEVARMQSTARRGIAAVAAAATKAEDES